MVAVPLLQRQLLERPGDENAGVVHQHADVAQGLGDGLHHPGDRFGLTHVGRCAGGLDAALSKLLHQLSHLGFGAGADPDPVTGLAQRERGGPADAFCCAGDEGGGRHEEM